MDNWSYVGATNVENDQHSATTNVGATNVKNDQLRSDKALNIGIDICRSYKL